MSRQLEALADAAGFLACTHPDCEGSPGQCATDHMRAKALKLAQMAFDAGRIAKAKPARARETTADPTEGR